MPEIRYLPSFQHDLNAIIEYITYTLKAPRAASSLLDELEKAIHNLEAFPLVHRVYRPLKPLSAEYRVITVKNYLVFYTVLEEAIEIHRIIYKKRNLFQLIQ